MLKIISPIDSLHEAVSLLDAGAAELYGGYVPSAWQSRFSLLASINQRTFDTAQISSREDLQTIIERVHDAGKRFSLTLNSPFYSDVQLPILLDYVDEVVSLGVDGIILADIALLRQLRQRHPDIELHASTLAHLGNSLAAQVYIEAGIDRMVFPRHIPVSEFRQIIAACPDIAFDAFLLVGKCPNTEGLCTFHHSSADKIWPCEIPYRIEAVDPETRDTLASAISRQASWSATNRRHGCGLCAIPELLRSGVSGLKLVGRGAPTPQKIKNIQLAHEFMQLAVEVNDFDLYRRRAMAAHEKRFGAGCSPNVCYFPEFYMAE